MIRLSALLLALIPMAAPAFAQDDRCVGEVHATGRGEVQAVPDMLRLTFRAEAEAEEPQAALNDAATRISAVSEALAAAGIETRDIATTEVSLSPVRERAEAGAAPKTTGWRAASSLRVAVRKLDAFGAVVNAATAAGANGLSGMSFDISDADEKRAEARTAAIANAIAKAKSMAAAADLETGAVLRLSDGSQGPTPVRGAMRAMAADAAAEMPISPGEQTISATATAVLELCG